MDTVLPPPSLPETLIAEGPSTKPSVMSMNRMMDDLFDERAARQLANELYVRMLGLNKYSEDDFHPETEFIHVGQPPALSNDPEGVGPTAATNQVRVTNHVNGLYIYIWTSQTTILKPGFF